MAYGYVRASRVGPPFRTTLVPGPSSWALGPGGLASGRGVAMLAFSPRRSHICAPLTFLLGPGPRVLAFLGPVAEGFRKCVAHTSHTFLPFYWLSKRGFILRKRFRVRGSLRFGRKNLKEGFRNWFSTPCSRGKPRGRRIEGASGNVPPPPSFEEWPLL